MGIEVSCVILSLGRWVKPIMLPLECTYAHVHFVLLVRVHICCRYMLVPRVWVAGRASCCCQSEAVGLIDTKLRSRCGALCAMFHLLVSTAALLRSSLVARMISLSSRDVDDVCSKRQVGWRGRYRGTAQRRRGGWAVFGRRTLIRAGLFNGCRSAVDMATQWIRWASDGLTQGQVARG